MKLRKVLGVGCAIFAAFSAFTAAAGPAVGGEGDSGFVINAPATAPHCRTLRTARANALEMWRTTYIPSWLMTYMEINNEMTRVNCNY